MKTLLTASGIIALVLTMLSSAQSHSRRQEIVTYYEQLPDVYQPGTLTKELTSDVALESGYYFAAYRYKSKPVHRIKQVSNSELISEFTYSYTKGKITEITYTKKAEEGTITKCVVTVIDIMRNIKCFDHKNKPLSEEWYNIKTTEYSKGIYDSTGVVIQTEWGRYSPPEKENE